MVITKDVGFFKKFGKYFIKYLRNHPQEIRHYFRAEKEYLIHNIGKEKRALEVGCGSGRIMKILANTCGHATGIDNSPYLLNLAKENLKKTQNTALYLMDMDELEKIDRKFDIITIMDNTLGNIAGKEKQVELLKKLRCLLNEDGKIIISAYSQNAKKVQENSYRRIGLWGVRHVGDYTYTNEGLSSERFTKEKLQSILKQAGLTGEIQVLTPISYLCEAKANNSA